LQPERRKFCLIEVRWVGPVLGRRVPLRHSAAERLTVVSAWAAGNRLTLGRVAVALLRGAPVKGTTPTKRLKAGWDDD